MKKKTAMLLAGAMMITAVLTGCGKNEEATTAASESTKPEEDSEGKAKNSDEAEEKEKEELKQEPEKAVGILLPSDEQDERWSVDGRTMAEAVETAGYAPEVCYAGEDSDTQVSQIKELLGNEKLSALIIAPVDPYGLTDTLAEIKDMDTQIPVFSYDSLIMDSDMVSYYATFDTRKAGNMVAESIIKDEELDKARENKSSRTIEFLMGSPDDLSALFFYNGVMEKLQEYFDDGTLVCTSQKTAFDDTAVMDKSRTLAKEKLQEILSDSYKAGGPDIICTGDDDLALAAVDVLEENREDTDGSTWPMITGIGCSQDAVKSIIQEKIAASLFFDNRQLAKDCVAMVDTYLKGEDEVEVTDYEQYDNGVKIIATYTSDIQLINSDNYQMLVDDGYYTEEELTPEVTPTAIPTSTPEVTPTAIPTSTPEAEPTVTPEADKTSTPVPGTEDRNVTPTVTPEEAGEEPVSTVTPTVTPEEEERITLTAG